MSNLLNCVRKNFLGLMLELGMTGMLGTAIILCISTSRSPMFNVNPWLATFAISDALVLGGLCLSHGRRGDTNVVEHMFRPVFGATGILMTWIFVQILLHESVGRAA